MSNTWFLTGALGCIGAWVTKTVLDRGDRAVVFDLGGDARRLRDLMDEVDPGQGLLVHEVPQPAGVAAQVEDDGAVAAIEDGLGDPRADAAEGARQEPGVAHALGGPLGPAEEPSVCLLYTSPSPRDRG